MNCGCGGSTSVSSGAAWRTSSRASMCGWPMLPVLPSNCRATPNFGGLYGSYAVTVGTINPSQPNCWQTIMACCSVSTLSIRNASYTATTRFTGITVTLSTV